MPLLPRLAARRAQPAPEPPDLLRESRGARLRAASPPGRGMLDGLLDALPDPRHPDPLVFGPPPGHGRVYDDADAACPCGAEWNSEVLAACWCCGRAVAATSAS